MNWNLPGSYQVLSCLTWKRKSTETWQWQKQLKPTLFESLHGVCTSNKDLETLDKKSAQALQDSRDQGVPSPGTLPKLMILAANKARSGGRKNKIKQNWTDSELYIKNVQRSVRMEEPSWAGLQQHRCPEHLHWWPEWGWQYGAIGTTASYSAGNLSYLYQGLSSWEQSGFSAWAKCRGADRGGALSTSSSQRYYWWTV